MNEKQRCLRDGDAPLLKGEITNNNNNKKKRLLQMSADNLVISLFTPACEVKAAAVGG